jgi:hypothetical protein
MDVLYFGQSSAGTADGSSWANRAAFIVAGSINSLIMSRDYGTNGPLTAYVENGATYTLTSTQDLGAATGYDLLNYCIMHGCDSSGNPLVPNMGWTAAEPYTQIFGSEEFPKIDTNSYWIDFDVGGARCMQFTNTLTRYGTIVIGMIFDYCVSDNQFGHVNASSFGVDNTYYGRFTNSVAITRGGGDGIAVGTQSLGMIRNVRCEGIGTRMRTGIGMAVYDTVNMSVDRICVVNATDGLALTPQRNLNSGQIANSTFIDCTTGVRFDGDGSAAATDARSTLQVDRCLFVDCGTDIGYDADTTYTHLLVATNNRHRGYTTRLSVDWPDVFEFDEYLTAATDADEFVNAGSGDYRIGKQALTHGMGFGVADEPKELNVNQVRPTALVGHWSASLDDDGAGTTTATDLSGNGHNGTKNGGLTEVSDPSFNGVRAWDMDGTDDYISIPDDDAFSFGNGTTDSPFSISTWVYVHTFDPVITPLVSKNSDFNRGEWYFSISNTQALQLTLIDDSLLGRCWRVGSGKTLSTNEWIHVVVTYDGSGSSTGIKFYVNGEEVSSLDNSNGSYVAMENLSDAVQIGRRDTGYELDGKVDDTRIYNALLSVDEIQALAANRVGREPLTDQNWKDVLDGMTQWIDGTVWYSLYPNFYYSLLNGQRWQGSGATWSRGTHPCGGNTIQTLTAGITTRLALPSVTVEQVQPLAESFYLCAWVKLADVSLRPQTIFAKHDTSTTERSVLFRVNSDGGALILVNKVGDGPNNIPLNSPGGYITDNTWAFVEGWRDTVNETLNLAINRTEFSMALSNGSLHDSAADGALFKQEDNADAFDVGELFGFAMIIGAVPSAENRDWIYNSGVGRTLEDWQRRQLRTPIIEVTGGGSAGTPAFASIN